MIADTPKDSIAYMDETGIDQYIHREYSRAKRGTKVIGRISGKKFKRTGKVAATIGKKIIAPLQYNGTMDSKLFEFWFEISLTLFSERLIKAASAVAVLQRPKS